MSSWIFATLLAVIFQTIRFMLQKSLSATVLSAAGATYARFFYAAPVVLGLLFLAVFAGLGRVPALGLEFWVFAWTGGFAQILATLCVVLIFQERNFAVGITLKKTEVLFAAITGFALLGDRISMLGGVALLIGFAAVLLLSKPDASGSFWASLRSRAVLLGIASGVIFSVSAVCYRGASLQIADPDPLWRAAVTLGAVTMSQMIAMGLWLAWREPGQLQAVWRARASASWVGWTSMAGSYFWFLAYTQKNAAYVNALGQSELILSLLASVVFFKERVTMREYLGIAALTLSVFVLLTSD